MLNIDTEVTGGKTIQQNLELLKSDKGFGNIWSKISSEVRDKIGETVVGTGCTVKADKKGLELRPDSKLNKRGSVPGHTKRGGLVTIPRKDGTKATTQSRAEGTDKNDMCKKLAKILTGAIKKMPFNKKRV